MSKTVDLMSRRQAAVARGVASATDIFVADAQNAEVWDVEGRRYLDFAMGIAVCNTGHANPRVLAAAHKQMQQFCHTAFQVSMYEPYITLAEELNALAPIENAKSVFFSTGAEAVENAVKIARSTTNRSAVISFRGAFHGRTALTATMTGKIAPYRAGAGAGAPAVFHAPFPVPHHGISIEDAKAGLATIFKTDVEARDVAAIIIEPVQGEGGFYAAPTEFIEYLRALCDEHGILLIFDEVQTGFGRTGKMFATEHYTVQPDLISVAKALASGFPISGVIGKADIIDHIGPGGLGGTFGGNPIACAAALETLKIIRDERLCDRSTMLGNRITERLQEIKAKAPSTCIGDIRGLGAMVAFELMTTPDSTEPDPTKTAKVTAAALKKGLIILSCGYWSNTIRILAPLTIPELQLEEGLDILNDALVEA